MHSTSLACLYSNQIDGFQMFDFPQRSLEWPSSDVWGLFKFLLICNQTLDPVSYMRVLFKIGGLGL